MPMPMPIIEANCGVNDAMSTNRDAMPMSMKPGTSPPMAVIMGRPMATTEPKAMRSTIAAAITPMISDSPGGSCSPAKATGLASSTWKVSVERSSRRAKSSSTASSPISKAGRS